MISLIDTTFIIPIYIDSDDRKRNVNIVLSFLNYHFKTNIIINELIDDKSSLDFLSKFDNLKIKHIKKNRDGLNYHRTKQLNEMLNLVNTPVVVNYDTDILLPVKSYIIAEYLIKNGSDVVYPYGFGNFQKKVQKSFDRTEFEISFDLEDISKRYYKVDRAEYGHCVFFHTDIYKFYGGENENFIAYGPEDVERHNRFEKLGCKISRIEDLVYHFEHDRTSFSDKSNPDFHNNQLLFNRINEFDKSTLINYYRNIEYRRKYNFNTKIRDVVQSSQQEIVSNPETIINIQPPIAVRNLNLCICGQPKDKIRYNFCQKCNRLY
jgi:hypothetical protein